jgi:hypothetical protein
MPDEAISQADEKETAPIIRRMENNMFNLQGMLTYQYWE